MILAVVAVGLCALVAVSWVAARDLLFPPVVFAGTWLLTFSAACLSSGIFYNVSELAALVYLVGASAFCVGGVMLQCLCNDRAQQDAHALPAAGLPRGYTRTALDILLILTIASVPLYWRAVSAGVSVDTAGELALGAMLQAIRRTTVESADAGSSIGLVGNVVVVAQFVSAAMYYERDGTWGRRLRAVVAVAVALLLGTMTGIKGSAVTIILTLFFISWLKAGKLPLAAAVLSLMLAVLMFSVGLVLLNFGQGALANDPLDAAGAVWVMFLNYWVGGLIAFGPVADNPDLLESNQHIGRFFLETARRLGMNVNVPNINASYTLIAEDQDSNTYTIYFSYFKDFGWVGTIVIMASLAMLLTIVYRRAKRGQPIAQLLYAKMCVAMVLSFHAEHFLLGLNSYAKAVLFFTFLYLFLPYIERTKVEMTANSRTSVYPLPNDRCLRC